MDEDIEYRIPEIEGISDQQLDQDITNGEQPLLVKKRWAFLKNIDKRKIILPLGVFVVIFLIYKAFNIYGAKKTQRAVQQKTQMQNIAARSGIVMPQKSAYVAEPSVTKVNDNNQNYNVLKQEIATVEADMHQGGDRLANLGSSINATQENVATITRNVKQISDVLQQEIAQVERLKQQLATKPIKQQKKLQRQQRKIKKSPLVKYHIRAMVPGRVWIESDDGKYNKTLKVGDELTGYGAVDYILYKEGMVLTSNGLYIQYGENDN